MSLLQRNALIRDCWVPVTTPPTSSKESAHFPIEVWAVIDDPRYQSNGERPFADIACYWPASKKWTVTGQCRGDTDVDDIEVRVTFYQPLPPLPY
jgi:hypothetical protein